MHIFRGMCTSLGTCEVLVRTRRSWGKIQVYQYKSRSMCTTLLHSHNEEACANMRTHMHIFRGMCTGLVTCERLVRMLRSWGNIQVNQHSSRSLSARAAEGAILSLTLTRRGRLRKCGHAYTHIQSYVH